MAEERADLHVDGVVAKAVDYYRSARDHTSKWRIEARECFDLVAGHQWDDKDIAALNDQDRPAVTINRMARVINSVVGTQVANRQETRFLPREMGDVGLNEFLSSVVEWVRDQTDAEDEESDAFEDMSTCGMGWIETRMDYDADPDGMIRMERVDPMEMYWDPTAKKRNLVDARWVMRIKRVSQKEFEDTWPDADFIAAAQPWDSVEEELTTRDHVYPQDAYKQSQARSNDAALKHIRVAQIQWAEKETVYRVGPKAERVTKQAFERLKPRLEELGIRFVEQKETVWRQAFVSGTEVLKEGDCPDPDRPTLQCMTLKRDRNANTWYGLVRIMKDPQRWGNKFFSQILDILNKNSKGGVMIEAGAVEDIAHFEDTWASADAVHVFQPGALTGGKVQPKPIVDWPAGLDRMMQYSLEGVHEATGINLELIGMAGREQAGVLEYQRKQAGLTIISPLFDAMRHYRKVQGRTVVHFVRQYISDGRLVRIAGDRGQDQFVPLLRDQSTGDYDVIVDESPTSPNMKEKVYSSLVHMLPILNEMGLPLPPELLDYAPIPSSLAQKWKELIQKQSQGGPQIPQEVQLQIQAGVEHIRKLEEENSRLKDKKAESEANIALKASELEAKRSDMEATHRLKLEEAQATYQLKLLELEQKAEIAGLEADFDARLKEAELDNKTRFQERELAMKENTTKDAIGKAAQSVVMKQPRRKISVERDDKGFLKGAIVEDILDDMEPAGTA